MTNEEEEAPPPRIVVSTKNEPCGCIKTLYSDDKGMLDPCDGHMLYEVAGGLARAAEILGKFSLRKVREQEQFEMQQIAANLNIKP